MQEFFHAWSGMRQFDSLDLGEKDVVFYAEDNASWVHFEPIIKALLEKHDQGFCYLTSSIEDPILNSTDKRIKAYFIGNGMLRTALFSSLKAGVVIMTMPDLDNYYIKRSKVHSVHYAYVFHNMASTHMVFRSGAYDHYDTIFCVGPHHENEIREAEKLYDLPKKNLVKHGNSRLDSVILEASKRGKESLPSEKGKKRVLIAPSYGKNSLLEVCGIKLIHVLLGAGYSVTARPHPLTTRHNKALISEIIEKYGNDPDFSIETNVASQASLQSSHLIISDYSGAAFEFAFGLGRPALFIDVPRKVNNLKYEELKCEPFEVFIRSEIGAVVSPDDLKKIPEFVESLVLSQKSFDEKIKTLRSQNIFNVGVSGIAGAEAIIQCLNRVNAEQAKGE
jgi:YidC/Oxa1 family membrane protein insertase